MFDMNLQGGAISTGQTFLINISDVLDSRSENLTRFILENLQFMASYLEAVINSTRTVHGQFQMSEGLFVDIPILPESRRPSDHRIREIFSSTGWWLPNYQQIQHHIPLIYGWYEVVVEGDHFLVIADGYRPRWGSPDYVYTFHHIEDMYGRLIEENGIPSIDGSFNYLYELTLPVVLRNLRSVEYYDTREITDVIVHHINDLYRQHLEDGDTSSPYEELTYGVYEICRLLMPLLYENIKRPLKDRAVSHRVVNFSDSVNIELYLA